MLAETEFFTVRAFMVNNLKLSGTERDVYAIVYGYTNKGKPYTGGTKHLAEWCGVCERQIRNAVKSLKDKHLLSQETTTEYHRPLIVYFANIPEEVQDVKPQ